MTFRLRLTILNTVIVTVLWGNHGGQILKSKCGGIYAGAYDPLLSENRANDLTAIMSNLERRLDMNYGTKDWAIVLTEI